MSADIPRRAGTVPALLRKLEARFREFSYASLGTASKALRLREIPSGWLILLATLFFFGSTIVAYLQLRAPYRWHEGRTPIWTVAWWTHPLEANVDAGLPSVTGDITAVALQPATGTDHPKVWVIGNKGLLAASADDGSSWSPLPYDSSTGEFARAPQGAPQPLAGLSDSESFDWEIMRGTVVRAAEIVDPQQANPSPQQTTPRKLPQNANAPNAQSTIPPTPGIKVLTSKSKLDFGEIAVGTRSTSQRLEITSGSDVEVLLLSVQISSPKDFEIVSTDCTKAILTYGRSCSVQLLFHPSALGIRNAAVQLTGLDKEFSVVAQLTGVGLPPSSNASPTQAQMPKGQAPAEPPDLLALDFKLGSQGQIAAGNGWLYTTNDQGWTWQSVEINPSTAAPRLRVGNREFLTAEAGSGASLKMTDAIYTSDARRAFRVRPEGGTMPPAEILEVAEKDTFGETPYWRQLKQWRDGDPAVTALWLGKSKLWLMTERQNDSYFLKSLDAGATWTAEGCRFQGTSKPVALTGVVFEGDDKRGWIVGGDGEIFKTDDGGTVCQPVTQTGASVLVREDGKVHPVAGSYWRFLPPWYLFSLLILIALVSPVVAGRQERTETPAPETESFSPETFDSGAFSSKGSSSAARRPEQPEFSIANMAVNDRPLEPGEPDALGLGALAGGLSFFLRNKDTQPPLCLAITGRWGSGKTSLMYLLKNNLQTFGTRPIWFNAWHHQKEDQLLAALLEAVKQQAAPRIWDRDWFKFRTRLLWKRLGRYAGYAILMLVLAAGILWGEVALEHQKYSMLAGLTYYLNHLFAKPAESATQAAAAAKALREEAGRCRTEAKQFKSLGGQLLTHAKTDHSPNQEKSWRATGQNLLDTADEATANATCQHPEEPHPAPSTTLPLPSGASDSPGALAKELNKQGLKLAALAGTLGDRADQLFSSADAFAQNELEEARQARNKNPFLIDSRAVIQSFPLASAFTALGLLLLASLKCLVAFGVNPSALLEGTTNGKGGKGAKEKACVRSRFAAEFADVTWAHGPKRTLLILVDDLDRCRPEKVREVLEAINFLVSSGDCYVVLGMDPEFVRQCLGMSFSDVVDAMPASALGLPDTATPETKREVFARRYLEKLIQIEVAIPEPSPEQQPKLFTREEAKNEERVQRYLHSIERMRAGARALLHLGGEAAIATLVVVALALVIWTAARSEKPSLSSAGTDLTNKRPGAIPFTPSSGPADNREKPIEGTSATAEKPLAGSEITTGLTNSSQSPAPQIQNSKIASSRLWILLPLIVPVLLFYLALTRQEDVVTHDTKPFQSSLDIWYPLVMLDYRNTPRNAKRFVNKVRYLAMRQKAFQQTKPITKGEKLLRRWLTGKEEAPSPEPPEQIIPESLLVPLAALHDCDPNWIDRIEMFSLLKDQTGFGTEITYSQLLQSLIGKHQQQFGNWKQISTYRSAFLTMQGEIASH